MSGKGSGRRPQLANDEVVSDNWSNVFGYACKRCGKRGLKADSVHTCSPQIKEKADEETSSSNINDQVRQVWNADIPRG